MANNATFNDVRINGMLTVNQIRIKNDKTLNITPVDRLTITTNNMYSYIDNRYLLFNRVDGEYGYGMSIDNDEIQLGYGTEEQFNSHKVQNALKINIDGINVNANVESIPSDEIASMLSAL